MHDFPVDIFAVKKYGIATWQHDFFWPVSDVEFVSLYDDIEQAWRDLILSSQPAISSALLHARVLPIEICHFLQAVQVIERVRKKGLYPVCSNDTRWYFQLLKRTSGKEKTDVFQMATQKRQMMHKILVWGKKKIREMQCNSFRTFFNLLQNRVKVYVFGVPSGIVKRYIRRLPNWISVTYPSDWSSSDQQIYISSSLHQELQEAAQKFYKALRGIAARYLISLSKDDEKYLIFTIENEMRKSARLLEQVREKMNSHAITHFMVSNIRASIPCAIAIVVKERGGRVTSFTHGGHIGLFRSPTMSMSEFAIANEFVMYTKGCYSLFQKIFEYKPPPFGNKVKFISSDSKFFFNLRRMHETEAIPHQVKKVMLIGCPQTQMRRPQASASLGLMQLDFELRVCDYLNKKGYKVLYKAHPDRLKEIEGIFDHKATVVTEYFEKITHLADAMVFGGIRTTAFPIAICTNKPIVAFMLNNEFPPPFPEAMKLLSKRCQFVFTKFDERNRVVFDEGCLLTALREKPRPPNMEYIEKYLFP